MRIALTILALNALLLTGCVVHEHEPTHGHYGTTVNPDPVIIYPAGRRPLPPRHHYDDEHKHKHHHDEPRPVPPRPAPKPTPALKPTPAPKPAPKNAPSPKREFKKS